MKAEVRIMPCLDIQNGRVAKGVNFNYIRDAGDSVEKFRLKLNVEEREWPARRPAMPS